MKEELVISFAQGLRRSDVDTSATSSDLSRRLYSPAAYSNEERIGNIRMDHVLVKATPFAS